MVLTNSHHSHTVFTRTYDGTLVSVKSFTSELGSEGLKVKRLSSYRGFVYQDNIFLWRVWILNLL